MNRQQQELDETARQWLELRAEQQRLRERERLLAQRLAALAGSRPEGTRSVRTATYHITTTTIIRRAVNPERWREVAEQVPALLHPVHCKLVVNLRKLRFLSRYHPKLHAALAAAITEAEPSIRIIITKNNE